MTLEKGSLLRSRYRIEDTIATGGMGAVYRALDETLRIQVAVKENFFSTDEYSRQFRREATILASLRHPNLPRVTDHFVIPGQGQYLVMDFIEGEDLREVITRVGTLSEAEVIRIGASISDALAYLHSRSPAIVHRDIKPGNLKITPTGQVVLVDFGLAKIAQGETTTTGAQALTPGYAPPEQYGQGTEPRSDVYALGATLYAALTGKIPEDGLSRAMGSADLTPTRRHNPRISDRLARVVERAMAIAPADRYQTAEAFKEGLLSAAAKPEAAPQARSEVIQPPVRAVDIPSIPGSIRPTEMQPQKAKQPAAEPPAGKASSGQPPAALPPASQPIARAPRKRGFPLGAVLGIGGVAALIGASALAFGLGLIKPFAAPAQPTPSSTPAPVPSALPTVTPPRPTADTTLTPTQTATLSPTDTPPPAATNTPAATLAPTQAATPLGGAYGQIAYSAEKDGKIQVWIINSDGTGNHPVTDLQDGACQPDWSPDGKQLVFISPCQSKKDVYNNSSLSIINVENTGLGSGLNPLDTFPGGDFDPAWSPDGKQIAFTTLRDNNFAHIYIYTLAENTVKCISRTVSRDYQPAWSPDGKQIAYMSTRLNQPQIWLMTSTGENAREFSSISTYGYTPAWRPDGSVVIFSEGNQRFLMERQVGDPAAQPVKVSATVYPSDDARYSPDGRWLAFTLEQDGNTDIYIMSPTGANLKRLTTNSGVDFHPVWRP